MPPVDPSPVLPYEPDLKRLLIEALGQDDYWRTAELAQASLGEDEWKYELKEDRSPFRSTRSTSQPSGSSTAT